MPWLPILLALCLSLTSCTTFDKTNILPGQRVEGLGFSFAVPTQNSWFAVVYGTSHRIKLSQLNVEDSYSITASLNKGPRAGMFPTAEAHLVTFKQYRASQPVLAGKIHYDTEERVAPRYGPICVQYESNGEDWRGRNNKGPALTNEIGLTCAHGTIPNTLLNIELSRRSDTTAAEVDLAGLAEELFSSIQFHEVE